MKRSLMLILVLALAAGSADGAVLLINAGTTSVTGWDDDSGANIFDVDFQATGAGIGRSNTGSGFTGAFYPSQTVYTTLDTLSAVDVGTSGNNDGVSVPASTLGKAYGAYRVFGASVTLTNLKPGTYDITAFAGEGRTSTHTISVDGGGGAVGLGTNQDIAYDNPGGLTAQQIWDSVSLKGQVTVDNGGALVVSSSGDLSGFLLATIVPEPATLLILAGGALPLLLRRRRKA